MIKKSILLLIYSLIFAVFARSVYSGEYVNFIGMEFIAISAGSFYMGSCNSGIPDKKQDHCDKGVFNDVNASADELPRHFVEVRNRFQIGVKEVSVNQFMHYVQEYNSRNQATPLIVSNDSNVDLPITNVSWIDVQGFLSWINDKKPLSDSGTYRLPTEAEWEYVARANKNGVYYFGNSPELLGEHAWYDKNSLDKKKSGPFKVGSKQANPWGIYDIYGNVWEWVSDWYEPDYYDKSVKKDPVGPDSSFLRVIRGGGWNFSASYCRAAKRDGHPPDARSQSIGFRVVRELPR